MSLRSPSSQLSCPVLLLPGGTRSHCAQKILLNLILTLMGHINKGMYFLPKHSQPLLGHDSVIPIHLVPCEMNSRLLF